MLIKKAKIIRFVKFSVLYLLFLLSNSIFKVQIKNNLERDAKHI